MAILTFSRHPKTTFGDLWFARVRGRLQGGSRSSLDDILKCTSARTNFLAHPGVQAVSPQVTISHPPGGKLPLLSARPVVTFPAAEHYRPLAGIKLYC